MQGHFNLHWPEIQQVGDVYEKLNNEIAKKKQITSY